ncbi:MAG TPA: rod shape-determining protein MreC, partial [Acidimicrobiia bacterium]|nr:rod shape-determining protein MreC [Acidimicrobiia bacterium]
MTYRRSKSRVVLAALLAAAVTIVTLGYRSGAGGPLHRIQSGALSLVSPLQTGVTKVLSPIGNFFDSIGRIPTLSSQNSQLRAQNQQLRRELDQYAGTLQQLNADQALLGEKDWLTGQTVGAQVIGGGPSNQEWTVFLDKGADQGVAVGMAVVAADGLVGRVTLVTGTSSKVLLLLDPTSAVGARLTTTGDTGLITGNGQGDLSLGLFDVTSTVATGEVVVTSGYDNGIYPPGIPIGRVAGVHISDNGLSKVAS